MQKQNIIVFLDVDSTLAALEGCDRLAERKGIGQLVSEMTQQTMNGTHGFDEIFEHKTNIIAPSHEELDLLGKEYCRHIVPGWQELIELIRTHGSHVGLITQGYRRAALHLAHFLGIAEEYTYGLEFTHATDGAFLGFPDQPLKHEFGKGVILEQFTQEHKVVFIGDGYGDMIAGKSAHLFIGCGVTLIRDKVKYASKYFCTSVEEIKNVLSQEHVI